MLYNIERCFVLDSDEGQCDGVCERYHVVQGEGCHKCSGKTEEEEETYFSKDMKYRVKLRLFNKLNL